MEGRLAGASVTLGVPRQTSSRMIDIASQPTIVVDLVMLSASEGGRNCPIQIVTETRYMPHLAIDHRENRIARTDTNGQSIEHYMGVLFEPALSATDTSTGSGRYPLRLLYHPNVNYATLKPGATFTVREGRRIVGHGVVVSSELAPNLPQTE